MGTAVVIGAVVAAGLFALGARTEWRARRSGRPSLDRRRAVPWIAGAAILVVSLLAAMAITIPVVIVGLALYSGMAAYAVWRMVTLDRASIWLTPSRRQARFAFSLIGLVWLGTVLGLLLWIADLLARMPMGG